MPDTLVAEPPSAPVAPAAPVITPPVSEPTSSPLTPNRAGTMASSLDSLRKLDPSAKKSAPPPAKPVAEPKKAVAPKPDEPVAIAEVKPATVEPVEPKVESDKNVPKDWKLFNTIKTENAKLKKQLEQLAASDSEKKTLSEQLEAHRKDLESTKAEKKKYEELLRFRDYQNTDEFQQKYVEPWESANAEAASNLQGIKITDDAGNERAITPVDIQALSDMDIPTARDTIRRLVPDAQDASDVRRHTDNIRVLKNKHKVALEKAWTDSDKWQKEQQSKYQQSIADRDRTFKAIHEENATLFKQFDEEARNTHKYLKPIEGDDEWNQKIEQAEKFVNESLNSNPQDPRLTKEERSEMIRRNTAVIHRSKMFGPLKLQVKRLELQNAELQKKVAAYGESEPKPGNGQGGKRSTTPAVSEHPMESLKQRWKNYVT